MSDRRRLAVSTAAFGSATALSRVAGVVREQVAAYYFSTSPALGAFLIAFNVPNLIRSLVADTAISAAFVPVFVELREKGREPEAWRVASIVLWLAAVVLGAISALFIIAAPWIMPLFVPGHENIDPDLVVTLSRYLFPIIVILGMTGVITGILNSYDIFGVPAIAPVAWNAIIILALVLFAGDITAYAVGVLIATVSQFLIPLPLLRGRSHFVVSLAWRHPDVQRILRQMLPVTIGLGLINFNLTIDLVIATLASPHADADLNYAFRLFMLPQGLFSVAVTVVLFPEISRLAARGDTAGFARTVSTGARTIVFLLLPAAAVSIALAAPIVRLIFQHGSFTELRHVERGRRAGRVLAGTRRERDRAPHDARLLRSPGGPHPDPDRRREPVPEPDPRPDPLQAVRRRRDRARHGDRHNVQCCGAGDAPEQKGREPPRA